MSALNVTIDISGRVAEDLRQFVDGLEDKGALHSKIAQASEAFIKARGAETAAEEHKTADRLGATPTGHLVDAYQAVEGQSSADGASLLVPSASRLRAAFGSYVLTPVNGAKYLTIPANAEAYGHRAGEFDDLFFMRVGPGKTPVLARRVEGTKDDSLRARPGQRRESRRVTQAEVMFVLVAKATIPEDRTLIPFDDLADEALDVTELYLNELRKESLS